MFGNIDTCKLLLRYRASWHGIVPKGVVGPLHFAARYGHPRLVEPLLESGEDIEATDLKGKTPLHQALKRGNIETAASLLNHGASVTAVYSLRRGYGASAFDLALEIPDEGQVAIMILSHARKRNVVISVARWTMDAIYGLHHDKKEWSRLVWPNLIAVGFDINPIILDGSVEMTLLRWAIRHGRLDYLDILPRLGAHIDRATKMEYRRVLQMLGWKPADFQYSTLPNIQLDATEIESRVKRYSGLQLHNQSFYCAKYIKDGKPSDNLQVLTSKPEFWLVEPGEEDEILLGAEQQSLDRPASKSSLDEDFTDDASAQPPIEASDMKTSSINKNVCALAHAREACYCLSGRQESEEQASNRIRFNITFVKDYEGPPHNSLDT